MTRADSVAAGPRPGDGLKKAYVVSRGCVENVLAARTYSEYLASSGYSITYRPEEADVIILNTCAVIQPQEYLSVQHLKKLLKVKKASAEILVGGCLPSINPAALEGVFGGRTFGPRDLTALESLAGEGAKVNGLSANRLDRTNLGDVALIAWAKRAVAALGRSGVPLPAYLHRRLAEVEDEEMFYIRIAMGCLDKCTYCAIRHSKGKLTSKPPEQVLGEFATGLALGFRRFVLAGEDTGCWGRDLGSSLADLLEKMLAHEGDWKVGIRFFEPRWLIEEMSRYRPIFASGRIVSLCIPVQSGSDTILGAMGRPYKASEFLTVAAEIRKSYPGIMLRTHILVGFPGETGQDFRESLALMDQVDFDMVITSIYSPRPGTQALRLPGQLALPVRLWRLFRLFAKVLYCVYLNRLELRPLARPAFGKGRMQARTPASGVKG